MTISMWLFITCIVTTGLVSVLVWRTVSGYRRYRRAKGRIKSLRGSARSIRERMEKITLSPKSGQAGEGVLMASYDSLIKAEEALDMAERNMDEPTRPRFLEMATEEAGINLAMSTILLRTFDGYEEWPTSLRLQQSSQECLYAIAEALEATSQLVPKEVAPILHEAAEAARTSGGKAKLDPIGAISDFQNQVSEILGGLITINRKGS